MNEMKTSEDDREWLSEWEIVDKNDFDPSVADQVKRQWDEEKKKRKRKKFFQRPVAPRTKVPTSDNNKRPAERIDIQHVMPSTDVLNTALTSPAKHTGIVKDEPSKYTGIVKDEPSRHTEVVEYEPYDPLQSNLEGVQKRREEAEEARREIIKHGDILYAAAEKIRNVSDALVDARAELKEANHYRSQENKQKAVVTGAGVGGVVGALIGPVTDAMGIGIPGIVLPTGPMGVAAGSAAGVLVIGGVGNAINKFGDHIAKSEDDEISRSRKPVPQIQRIRSPIDIDKRVAQIAAAKRFNLDAGGKTFKQILRELVAATYELEDSTRVLLAQDDWMGLPEDDLRKIEEHIRRFGKRLRRLKIPVIIFVISSFFRMILHLGTKKRQVANAKRMKKEDKKIRKARGEHKRYFFTVICEVSIFQLVDPVFSDRLQVYGVHPRNKRQRILLLVLENKSNSAEVFHLIVQRFTDLLGGRPPQEQYELLLRCRSLSPQPRSQDVRMGNHRSLTPQPNNTAKYLQLASANTDGHVMGPLYSQTRISTIKSHQPPPQNTAQHFQTPFHSSLRSRHPQPQNTTKHSQIPYTSSSAINSPTIKLLDDGEKLNVISELAILLEATDELLKDIIKINGWRLESMKSTVDDCNGKIGKMIPVVKSIK